MSVWQGLMEPLRLTVSEATKPGFTKMSKVVLVCSPPWDEAQ